MAICSWGYSYKIAVIKNNSIWEFLRSDQVKKWLINCSYNHEKRNIRKHTAAIRKSLDWYCTKYENVIVLEDFNEEALTFSKLSNENFNREMLDRLLRDCIDLLNQRTPCNTKMLGGNQCRFLNKGLWNQLSSGGG